MFINLAFFVSNFLGFLLLEFVSIEFSVLKSKRPNVKEVGTIDGFVVDDFDFGASDGVADHSLVDMRGFFSRSLDVSFIRLRLTV